MAGNHSYRWCCPHGWSSQDHRQPLWRRITSFLYMYHVTVWGLHQVPQMWKWQPLDILDVVHGYDRGFAGPHLSIQRGRLDATAGIRTSHDLMVLRIRQVEQCTLSPMLICPDVSAAHNAPRCACWIHARMVFSSVWLQQPIGRIPVDQTIEETGNKDTQTPGRPRGSVWNQGLWADTTWPPSIGPCTWETMNKDTQTPGRPRGSVWNKGLWADTNWLPSIGPCTWKR